MTASYSMYGINLLLTITNLQHKINVSDYDENQENMKKIFLVNKILKYQRPPPDQHNNKKKKELNGKKANNKKG